LKINFDSTKFFKKNKVKTYIDIDVKKPVSRFEVGDLVVPQMVSKCKCRTNKGDAMATITTKIKGIEMRRILTYILG